MEFGVVGVFYRYFNNGFNLKMGMKEFMEILGFVQSYLEALILDANFVFVGYIC